ncbi:dienelactone hydrolase family protein [Kitasatospora cathayae]|uniref:Dienelactone hydrolase family protein n=1 Tax=Kitasatospora cathayae TaxID=3004092 RepID=A0ABY7PZV8_9ACTN|nr:dienelactone hydrolase family protein [Kitasatospora sp. HUAS 3-15]WBP85932.1 dienelactone hydrolase family protein [Kitasatospora sp. HUAS 3-15]
MTVRGTTVDIQTADGTADAYLAHPDDGRPHPGVLLYQDAFGLRPHLKAMADRIAEAGYTVLVPNAYYRKGRAPLVELPELIDIEQAGEIFTQLGPLLMAVATPEVAARDADAYLAWFDASPLVQDGQIGVTGYCLGAFLALRTAISRPDRVAAAACFHGGHLATDRPDSPHLDAQRITAELYFGHADQDDSMPPEQIARLGEALTAAGVRYRAEVYEGAGHGFTQADTNRYDAVGDARHWAALFDLLARALPA